MGLGIPEIIINPGNFQSLIDFRTESGNKILKEEHFETCPRNATYHFKKPLSVNTLVIKCW